MKIKNKKKVALFACVGILAAMPFVLGNTDIDETSALQGTLLNRVVTFKSDPSFYNLVGGYGEYSYDLDFFIVVNGVRHEFTSISFGEDLFGNGGEFLKYNMSYVYSSNNEPTIGLSGWLDSDYTSYGTITITGGDDVNNGMLLSCFYGEMAVGMIESISEYTPPAENLDLFDQIYDILNAYLFDGQVTQEMMSYKNLMLIAGASVLSFLIIAIPFIAVFGILRLFFR